MNVTVAFFVKVSIFPSNLVRIGPIVKKWFSSYSTTKMAVVAAILKNTLPVLPPVWEQNSWFVTSNQKSNFCGVILTFKGSLFLRALMLKRFSAANRKSRTQNGSKFWCFLGWRPPISEFESSKPWKGTCTKQNTSFELWSVRIGTKLRPVGEMRKQKKRENESHKPWYFTTVWRRPLSTDLNEIWYVCRSYRRNYVYQ